MLAAYLLLLHGSLPLALDLVAEVEESLVEMVDAHVAVLTTTGVALARGVGGDCVEGTEVATDTADLVLEDLVVEAGLEFTLARGRGGDIHGGLATTQNHKVLLRGHGGTVQRRVGGVGLEHLQVAGGDQLGRLVFGGGDEVGAVLRPLKIGKLHVEVVDRKVFQLLAGLVRFLVSVMVPMIIISVKKTGSVRTLASYWLTLPSSWPAMMYLFM